MTVQQLAELVQGTVQGDGDVVIQGARPLQDSKPGDITFVEHVKNFPNLEYSNASAALVPTFQPVKEKTLIQVADPLMAFVAIFRHFQGKTPFKPFGIDPHAAIHPSARIGAEPSIAPFVEIGEGTIIGQRCQIQKGVTLGKNCRIGDDVVLFPNVVLYEDTIVGDRVIIHANSVIGADGFGYRFHKGRHVKVPQLSNVIIESDVEIGACSCVDRGTFEPTRIGEGTKIDNLVQVAHNCQIGKHNILAAQVGIAGSSILGNHVIAGGQAGVSDHCKIGDGVMLGAKTGIFHDVAAGKRMFLYPAHEERDAARIIACLKKLPSMRRSLLRVLKELNLTEYLDDPPVRAAV
jgi:UDP-3-O-[3-hydroxymyristoyl] glucosamine N-acyltransferase